jgi:integrase/recombinase XerD
MPVEVRREELTYLTREEWGRLLKVIKSPRDRAIFLMAYTYGLRASEVGLLRVTDIDFARDRIYIRRLKGSISGEWRLMPEVEKALKRWLQERQRRGWGDKAALFLSNRGLPIDRTTLHVLMRKYGEAAGLPPHKRHFHVLKHTAAAHLLEATHDIVGTKDWLGHRNISSTMRYVQLLGFHRDQFAEALLRQCPPPSHP